MTLGSWMLGKMMLGKIIWERYMFLYYETVIIDRIRHREFWAEWEGKHHAEERD